MCKNSKYQLSRTITPGLSAGTMCTPETLYQFVVMWWYARLITAADNSDGGLDDATESGSGYVQHYLFLFLVTRFFGITLHNCATSSSMFYWTKHYKATTFRNCHAHGECRNWQIAYGYKFSWKDLFTNISIHEVANSVWQNKSYLYNRHVCP